MSNIITLEELAKQKKIDISEYGLKAEGLVILHHVMEELRADPENRDQKINEELAHTRDLLRTSSFSFEREKLEKKIESLESRLKSNQTPLKLDFEVEPAFFIPKSIKIEDSPEAREAYFNLTSTSMKIMSSSGMSFNKSLGVKIILARSSDEHEEPGKFETHFSLYNPEYPSESFKRWLKAAKKVRESGAGCVIGQGLAAYGTDLKASGVDAYILERIGRPSSLKFGFESFGFVANTGGILGSDVLSVSAVAGLTTKIVRGDQDHSLIFTNGNHYNVLHKRHNYSFPAISGTLPQENMDIIEQNDPAKIKTIRFVNNQCFKAISMEYGAYAFPTNAVNIRSFFKILELLKERAQSHIEIEGSWSWDEKFPHIFQLRRYELPKNRLSQLTSVDQKYVLQEPRGSYIADLFKGDLVYFHISSGIDTHELRSHLNNPFIFVIPNHTIPYGSFDYVDLYKFQDMAGMIVPIANFSDHSRVHAHTVGYMISTLTEIQKKHPVIGMTCPYISVEDIIDEFKSRVEIHPKFTIVRNVTVESDGKTGQMYFNK